VESLGRLEKVADLAVPYRPIRSGFYLRRMALRRWCGRCHERVGNLVRGSLYPRLPGWDGVSKTARVITRDVPDPPEVLISSWVCSRGLEGDAGFQCCWSCGEHAKYPSNGE
jgi:hypothetical protein